MEHNVPLNRLITQDEQVKYFFKYMKEPSGRLDDFLHEYHVFCNTLDTDRGEEYVIARYNYSTGLFVFPYSIDVKEETGVVAFITRDIHNYIAIDRVPRFRSRKAAVEWAKKNLIQVSKTTLGR